MASDNDHDLVSIRAWMAKEDYLPQDLDDMLIKKFLHSCYGSLEQTKKCIEKFCTTRSNMLELYTDRDPTSEKLQTAFSITSVTTYLMEDEEILIYEIDDPTLDNYNFYDALKAFTIQTDFWLKYLPIYPNAHIFLLDMKHYYLKILPKINLFLFKQFLTFALEAMPLRLKQIHAYNCPTYYDKLFALVKPALPQEICDLIHFHPNTEGLHKFIDKKYLPIELGGDAASMKEEQKNWVKKIVAVREIYLDDNLWKADLKKKSKANPVSNAMNGSFRSLSID